MLLAGAGCAGRFSAVVLGLTLAMPLAHGDDLPGAIDLANFGRGVHADGTAPGRERAGGFDDVMDPAGPPSVVPVAYGVDSPANRFYVSGIAGGSFATIDAGGSRTFAANETAQTGSVNETLFTGGGAIGTAFTRPTGLLRMEVEGRARGPMSGQIDLTVNGVPATPLDVQATNGWSALVNFWRDYFVTDAIGIYAGGGFGVGGYRYAMATPADTQFQPLSGDSINTTFAWQAGTGVVYEISDRITLDTGYRFFAMTPDSTTLYVGNSAGLGAYTSAFSASELLVSLRIYEPFRRWR